LLDPVHEPFTGFWEGEVHLVGLEFEVTLAFGKLTFFLSKVLGALLECVLFQTGLSLHETLLDLFKFLALLGDLTE
jgi:hypothetical protein